MKRAKFDINRPLKGQDVVQVCQRLMTGRGHIVVGMDIRSGNPLHVNQAKDANEDQG